MVDTDVLAKTYEADFAYMCRFLMKRYEIQLADAEDIVQQAMLDVWEKRAALTATHSLRALVWAFVRVTAKQWTIRRSWEMRAQCYTVYPPDPSVASSEAEDPRYEHARRWLSEGWTVQQLLEGLHAQQELPPLARSRVGKLTQAQRFQERLRQDGRSCQQCGRSDVRFATSTCCNACYHQLHKKQTSQIVTCSGCGRATDKPASRGMCWTCYRKRLEVGEFDQVTTFVCRECDSSERPHHGHGYCLRCHQRHRGTFVKEAA